MKIFMNVVERVLQVYQPDDANPKSTRSVKTFLGPGLSAVLNREEAMLFFCITTMRQYIKLMKKHML